MFMCQVEPGGDDILQCRQADYGFHRGRGIGQAQQVADHALGAGQQRLRFDFPYQPVQAHAEAGDDAVGQPRLLLQFSEHSAGGDMQQPAVGERFRGHAVRHAQEHGGLAEGLARARQFDDALRALGAVQRQLDPPLDDQVETRAGIARPEQQAAARHPDHRGCGGDAAERCGIKPAEQRGAAEQAGGIRRGCRTRREGPVSGAAAAGAR